MTKGMTLRKAFFLTVALILAIASSCIGTSAYKPRIVALNGVTGLGLAKLIINPGYEVEIGKSADVAVARLNTKGADAAALPISTAALLRSKGTAIKLAAITNYGSLYIVSSKEGHDLASHAAGFLGVPGKGTMPDVTLSILLASKGAKPTGVQYYSSPAELANLLAAGKVEAALLPEPWVSQAIASNSALSITYDIQAGWKGLFGIDYPLSCVVVTEEFARQRPQEYVKLLKDIEASVAWVSANPSSAALIAEEKLSMARLATEASIPRCNFKYLDGEAARISALSFYEKVLLSFPALIGGKLPDEAFYAYR